ncbi:MULTISPECIES: hypothetical protein [Burkholderia cepacia complex]|uniref:hypothetical protein n=1 Tax=Burkholderia cenocepacia TaxID=95486 RepID=UPI0022378023|nr:hypothetical protein [Burkholderia cenocepacia]MCW5156404.1 hypothetical protein [Burkholderia cenocepacia]
MTVGTLIATIGLIGYMILGFITANYCFKKYLYYGNGKWIFINLFVVGIFSLYFQYIVVAIYHIIKGTQKTLREQQQNIEYVFPEQKDAEIQQPQKKSGFIPDTLD